MPCEDRRDRVGDGVDLGRFGVDVEGDADDDGAEVEGTGDRRGDRPRGSAARPCRGRRGRRCPACRTGVGPGAGADVRRCRLREAAGQDGVGLLGLPALGGGRGEGGVRAVGDAGELAEQALGQGGVDPGRVCWVPSWRASLQGEGDVGAGARGRRCRRRRPGVLGAAGFAARRRRRRRRRLVDREGVGRSGVGAFRRRSTGSGRGRGREGAAGERGLQRRGGAVEEVRA